LAWVKGPYVCPKHSMNTAKSAGHSHMASKSWFRVYTCIGELSVTIWRRLEGEGGHLKL